jgi:hypothetical protein
MSVVRCRWGMPGCCGDATGVVLVGCEDKHVLTDSAKVVFEMASRAL